MTREPPLAAWATTRRTALVRTPIFGVAEHTCQAADAPRPRYRYVITAPDWVNVLPITDAGRVVLVEQYRHGLEQISLEIPGGVIDPGDVDPAAAAARELREETGYAAPALELLGVVAPNPAIQTNRCHCFLARPARRVGPPQPDETEELRVSERPLAELLAAVRRGEVAHSLVVAAIAFFLLREGGPFDPPRR